MAGRPAKFSEFTAAETLARPDRQVVRVNCMSWDQSVGPECRTRAPGLQVPYLIPNSASALKRLSFVTWPELC